MVDVRIDRDGCISCANCWTVCPEFFIEDPDDNRSSVIEKYRAGDPSEGQAPDDMGCVKQAGEECPVQVIHVGG